jgi:hypothetical protein
MASTINASTASGGGIIQTADASGVLALQAAGTTIASLSSTGAAVTGTLSATGTVADSTGTLRPLISGTVVTATTAFPLNFTNIPSWVKRITVMFASASPSLGNWFTIQLGTSVGIVTSGYLGSAFITTTSGITAMQNSSAINIYNNSGSAADTMHGSVVLNLLDPATNTWTAMGLVSKSNALVMSYVTGSISLASALTQVSVAAGSGSLDGGSINIMYE